MRHIKLSIFKINLLFNTFLTKKIHPICEIGKIWIIHTKAERLSVSKIFFLAENHFIQFSSLLIEFKKGDKTYKN